MAGHSGPFTPGGYLLTVKHTTLAGIEPITFRLLVRRATSRATETTMLNILETVLLQSREGRRCLYLAAAGLLHLEEEEKWQHNQHDGLEIEEETTPSRRTRKPSYR